MQCKSNGSGSIESSSDRNSFHGDGSERPALDLRSVAILELLWFQIRQQIPMHRFLRSIPNQPLFLAFSLWRPVKNVLFNQAAFIELRPEFTKRLYSGVVVARGSFSDLKSKTNDEPQTILQVEFPSLLNQPIRCMVTVLHRNPGESLCDTGFKSVLP